MQDKIDNMLREISESLDNYKPDDSDSRLSLAYKMENRT